MVTKKSTKAATKKQIRHELEEFFERYAAILYAARDFIERVVRIAERSGEDPWVTTQQVVEHIAGQLPATYIKTFGTDEPRRLKVWRLKTIFSNANYLGAYEAIGVIARRGKGLTIDSVKRPRRLRVIKGGRA